MITNITPNNPDYQRALYFVTPGAVERLVEPAITMHSTL